VGQKETQSRFQLDWVLVGKVSASILFSKLHIPMKQAEKADHPDYVEVFTPYITIKGVKVYRKDGKMWHFYAKRR
jgi:hypothetical protein